MNCLTCNHPKSSHIYEEGECRPGFICRCTKFEPAGIIPLKRNDLIPVSAIPEKPFEERWEAFRLSREISQETFVASGYGFVEDLEEFMTQENQRLINKLNDLTYDLESLVDAVRDCGLAVSRGEQIRKKRGWP